MKFEDMTAAKFNERCEELQYFSDVELLRHVIGLEEAGAGMKFPSLPHTVAEEDGGRHFAPSRGLGDAISFEQLVAHGARTDWRLVYETYCDIVVQNWEQTWESCRTGSFTSLLKHPESAWCLALVAWRHRRDSAPATTQNTVWRALEEMGGEQRREALAAFGYDGAVSAAYEGVAIKPSELAK